MEKLTAAHNPGGCFKLSFLRPKPRLISMEISRGSLRLHGKALVTFEEFPGDTVPVPNGHGRETAPACATSIKPPTRLLWLPCSLPGRDMAIRREPGREAPPAYWAPSGQPSPRAGAAEAQLIRAAGPICTAGRKICKNDSAPFLFDKIRYNGKSACSTAGGPHVRSNGIDPAGFAGGSCLKFRKLRMGEETHDFVVSC